MPAAEGDEAFAELERHASDGEEVDDVYQGERDRR